MNNQVLTATSPLWKDGRNGNVQFLASWKRLQKEDPITYGLIDQKEGFECETAEHSYKVGKNSYGLYLMRKRLTGLEKIPNLERTDERDDVRNEHPTSRTTLRDVDVLPRPSDSASATDHTLIVILAQLTDAIKLQTLAMLASSDSEKNEIRKKVLS